MAGDYRRNGCKNISIALNYKHKHFKKEKKFEDTCKNLGVISSSKAPTCYTPDLETFRKITLLPEIENIGNILKVLSAKQCRILAALIVKQAKIKEIQFYFGQPLFVCLGDEFLSHYFKSKLALKL